MQITDDALLEQQADTLLCGIDGVYTEAQIEDRCGRDYHPPLGLLFEEADNRELVEYMTERDAVAMGKIARLTDSQLLVCSLRIKGLRPCDIAECLNVTRPYITKTLKSCAVRILSAWKREKWYGLWIVYWELVGRH